MGRDRPGAIYCEEAYAQGKMLESSQWDERLPRGITPSDADLIFDNRGYLLFCEFSSEHTEWSQVKLGQKLLYESIVAHERATAALCKHSVGRDKKIDTYGDVDSFQVMFCDKCELRVGKVIEGHRWPKFVIEWFKNANATRELALNPPPLPLETPRLDFFGNRVLDIELA